MTSLPRIPAEILEELKSLDQGAGPYVVQAGFLLLSDTATAWLGLKVLRVGTQSEAECGDTNRSINTENILLLKHHTHTYCYCF